MQATMNATDGHTVGPDPRPAANANNTKAVSNLIIELVAGNCDVVFDRDVEVLHDATVKEVVEAAMDDLDFRNPMIHAGELSVWQGRKRIVLARYSTDFYDGCIEAEVSEVIAHYKDGTSEAVPVG